MKIDKLTHPEVDELFKKKIAIIPIGATEQHGPHLPMGTDTFYADYIAEKVGEKLNIAVLPPVCYSVSGYNFPYPTITIEPETLNLYLKDICNSLKFFNIDKVIFLVGHGGENCSAVENASYCIARDININIKVIYPWQYLPKEEYEKMNSDWHAGFLETSDMLFIKPELVKEDKIKKSSIPPIMEFIGNYKLSKRDERNGVFGNPVGANKNIGEKNMQEIVKKLVDLISKII